MFKLVQRIKSNRVKNRLLEELDEILQTMDYSNYELSTCYDEETKKLIVPKPVLALALIDDDVVEWLRKQCMRYPVSIMELV